LLCRWRIRLLERDLVRPLAVVLGSLATVLLVEIVCLLVATHGHFVYALEAPYTHLALAEQIAQGNYGLDASESAAPSSSILYPFLLAGLRPLGLGAMLPLAINFISTLAAGGFVVLLSRELGIQLRNIAWPRLFLVTATVAIALNLPGLALTGMEHSLHVAITIAYMLGLVRFVERGRCDWWWFACAMLLPAIRFEAGNMLVATTLIFLVLQRYAFALVTILTGCALAIAYLAFLRSLDLPPLPSSVLARSEWAKMVVVYHSNVFKIIETIAHNFYANLNTFGAAQMLGGVALGVAWLGGAGNATALSPRAPVRSHQIRLVTLGVMIFITLSQLAGGKLGWVPPRYDAYVLALNLCGIAIIYRDTVNAWCGHATWQRVSAICAVFLLIFAGYVAQSLFIPGMARKEYQGPFQLHRFVTEFYRAPVAIDQLGYVNFDNPDYVLDLSGLGSETARTERAQAHSSDWMDGLLAKHDVGLALIDPASDPNVPAEWVMVGDLRPGGDHASGPDQHRTIFYARRHSDVAAISDALDRFAPTLPANVRLTRVSPVANTERGA